MALRLKRGVAPGLTEARPLADHTQRWRWIPGPSLRRRGFKSLYLLGGPGTLITDSETGWRGYGFAEMPTGCEGLTLDGPPLGLDDAIAAVQALTAATKAAKPVKPVARPTPTIKPVAAYFDEFLEACTSGKVLKKQRGESGQKEPIGAHTVATYQQGLARLRPIIGEDDPRRVARADLEAAFEGLIETSGWHSAIRAQRSLARCFNWLREKSAQAAAVLPPKEAYTAMELGQPKGRLRMADPGEAAAMFDALARPEYLAQQIAQRDGIIIDRDEIPAAVPGAAAAWLFALWTCQRVNDAVSASDHQVAAGSFSIEQSKTRRPVHIPLLEPAREAIALARAARGGLGINLPEQDTARLVFYDVEARLPYRQVKGPGSTTPGQVYFKRLNAHWVRARAFAARLHPSLIGEGVDAFGKPNKALTMADSRDTGVTRLFEALGTENEARLAEIAAWHGSSVENLLKLLKHYLVINPAFAAKAGDALERLARVNGIKV